MSLFQLIILDAAKRGNVNVSVVREHVRDHELPCHSTSDCMRLDVKLKASIVKLKASIITAPYDI